MKREYYMTYRGQKYGPYASLALLLSDLRCLVEMDELHDLEPDETRSFYSVETETPQTEGECSA